MKILHVIDDKYFETHKKTISELILALNDNGVSQKIFTKEKFDLGLISNICEILRWKVSKKGNVKLFSSRLKLWFLLSSFLPDVIIKWGEGARKIVKNTQCVQISFLNEKENLSSIDNSDYIVTNNEDVFSFVKENGYSGAKSFLLTPFVYQYKNTKPLSKKDFFIPEKANVGYLGGTFVKNIGYEKVFDVLGVVDDTYFFVCGNGPDEEYVKDFALRVNLKARSRFVTDIDKSFDLLSFANFAFLPFNDSQISKYILEAQMQKKLVITIKNPISEELVREGKTGFFVDKSDMYLIKKKLKEVLKLSNEEISPIIENAYENAIEHTSDKIVSGYIQIFDELTKRYKSRKNLLNN